MRRRFIYLLLFGFPTLIAATLASVVTVGIITGALWLFVLGDDPWPPSARFIAGVIAAFVFLVVAFLLLAMAYKTGKQQEAFSRINKKHLAFSGIVTFALIGVVILHQYSVGNFGTPSYSVMCADYCRVQGFNSSSLPPRDQGSNLCRCLDSHGDAAVTVSLDQLYANEDR